GRGARRCERGARAHRSRRRRNFLSIPTRCPRPVANRAPRRHRHAVATPAQVLRLECLKRVARAGKGWPAGLTVVCSTHTLRLRRFRGNGGPLRPEAPWATFGQRTRAKRSQSSHDMRKSGRAETVRAVRGREAVGTLRVVTGSDIRVKLPAVAGGSALSQ